MVMGVMIMLTNYASVLDYLQYARFNVVVKVLAIFSTVRMLMQSSRISSHCTWHSSLGIPH